MSYRRKDKSSNAYPYQEDEDTPSPSPFSPKKTSPYTSSFGSASYGAGARHNLSAVIKWKLLASIFVAWVLLVHYFERIVPRQTMNACQWSNWEKWPQATDKHSQPHRIALIPDPQIIDDHTYPNKSRLFNYMTTLISDNYLHRNHRFMQSILDPDTTIFLGDLFDGGREWDDDDKWFKEYQRFMGIFPSKPNRRTIMSLPGNHDIGYQTIRPKVVNRFSAFFGEVNDFVELGNHSIIMIDTISMSHPDKEISAESKQFLATLDDQLNPQLPRILLSHVPLYRFADKQLCGPLREKGDPFPLQRGYEYQTVLDWEVTQQLLHTVDPDVIFSGDDHDYCEVKHKFNFEGIERVATEISAKTASMTCGVKYPALQLLSLYNPYDPNPKKAKSPLSEDDDDDAPTKSYQTELCYLPSPYFALNVYGFAFLSTIGSLVLIYLFPKHLVRWVDRLSASSGHAPLKDKSTSLPQWSSISSRQSEYIRNSLSLERSSLAFWVNFVLVVGMVYSIFGFYYWYI